MELEYHPVSAAQGRLWFAQRLDPDSCAYTLGQTFTIAGPLDENRLRVALRHLTDRHRSLRTRFHEQDGMPVQVVDNVWSGQLSSREIPEQDASQAVTAAFARPFNLCEGPLFRADLLRLAPEHHLLALTMHHIISDGWSLNIMLRDLSALYRDQDAAAASAPAPVQYTDLAAREAKFLQSEDFASKLANWARRLEGAPTWLRLPSRTEDRSDCSFQGRRLRFDMPDELAQRLGKLAAQHHVTLNMAVFALFQAFLGRLSGQQDLLVGMPTAGRLDPDAQEVVGFFVNTLPVRADLRGAPSTVNLFERVRDSVVEAYEDQGVPFDRIVEAVNPVRLPGLTPLVQVTFQLIEGSIGTDLYLAGTRSRPYEDYRRSVAFDLLLNLYHVDGGLHGELYYREDAFDPRMMASSVENFLAMCQAAVTDPDTPVEFLGFTPAASSPSSPPDPVPVMPTLAQRLAELAETRAERVLVVEGERVWTAAALAEAFRSAATAIAARGLGPDSLVELRGPVTGALLAGLLGCIGAGVPVLAGSPGPSANRMAGSQLPPDLVLSSQQDGSAGAGTSTHEIPLVMATDLVDTEDERAQAASLPAVASDRPALLVRAGVDGGELAVVTHAALADLLQTGPGAGRPLRTAYSPAAAAAEPWQPLLAALRGEEVHLLATLDDSLLAAVKPQPFDLLELSEPELTGLPAARDTGSPGLARSLVVPGTDLRTVAGAVRRYGPPECLGTALIWSAQGCFDAESAPGCRICVLDPADWPLPPGIVGEVCIGAGHLASGYVGKPAETAHAFLPDPAAPGLRLFRTGERGRLTPDGRLQLLGIQEERATGWQPASGPQEQPRPGIEREVASVMADLLGLPRIGRHDNFFTSGGHSLTVVRLVSRLQEQLGRDLSVRTVFERPTVATLAAFLSAAEAGTAATVTRLLRRDEPQRPAPASFAQQRLWFLQQLEPDGTAYNMYESFRIQGPLDLTALTAAVSDLTDRHESLRTRFAERDGTLLQIIDNTWPGSLQHATLPDRTEPLDWRLQEHLASLTSVPFDLAWGPVFRANLLRLAEDDHLLTLCVHHAVSDGRSIEVLRAELAALYNARLLARAAPLPPLPVQYSDYAVWQRENLVGEFLEEQLDYWTEEVRGAPQLLPLPADRSVTGAPGNAGGIVQFGIPDEVTGRLGGIGEQAGATFFMVTLAAFQALLARISGEPDFLVGVPVDGRNRPELENLVGFFVNTLAIRSDLRSDPTFTDLLAETRRRSVSGFAHQDLPFERLVEAVNPRRLPGRNPLVQVTFHLFAAGRPGGLDLTGTVGSYQDTFNHTARFELSLDLYGAKRGVNGNLCYREDSFSRRRAEEIAEAYLAVLTAIAAEPESRISGLPVPLALTESPRSSPERPAGAAVAQSTASAGPAEYLVATVMAEVLGLPGRLNRGDDFFARGGHSLTAVQLASRLRTLLEADVTVLMVFENPTVATLAAAVAAAAQLHTLPLRAGCAGNPAPVSFAQQRLWLIQQLDEDGTAYNMYEPIRIRGPLDQVALSGALRALTARHEALRTRFLAVDGHLVQVVDDTWEGKLGYADLSASADRGSDVVTVLQERLRTLAAQAYDLALGPLFRADLLRLGPDDHVLVLAMHHILSDGRSMEVIKQDLSAMYNAALTGVTARLAELPVRYADFAAWQREFLSGETLDREISYWKAQLDDAPLLLRIPTDYLRTSTVETVGGVVHFDLSPELTVSLRGLGERIGATLFTVLLAAFQTQMAALSGQSDVIVGVPTAARTRPEIENVVGFFVNTLALRADLNGAQTFDRLLQQTRDRFLGALTHQDLPFDRLVEAVNPERLLGTVPITQVACQLFEEEIITGLDLRGTTSEYHDVFNQTARFDLQLDYFRIGEGFTGRLYYRTDLFRHDTAVGMTQGLLRLLDAVAAHPGGTVQELASSAQIAPDHQIIGVSE